MAEFASSEELYEVMTPFYESLTTDPEIGPKFSKANTSFRTTYTEPKAVFLLDCTQSPPVLTTADEAEAGDPACDLTMSADDGHRFWLGKLNLPVALAKRKVKIGGGVTSVLGLVPAMTPAYAKYRAHLEGIGRSTTV